jgi:hypothetical protein
VITQHAHVRVQHGVHALGHDAQGVDVQAGVRLVEDRHLGFQDRHLEHLQALLLAPGEALVHVSRGDRLVHLEQRHLLADELAELAHRDPAPEGVGGIDVRVRAEAGAAGVDRRPQEARHRQAGDRHRVLEGEEHAEPRALVDGELKQVVTLPEHLARLDDVGGMAHERVRQGGLARAVGAHDGVDLAVADGQLDPLQDLMLRIRDRGDVQVVDDEVLIAHVGSNAPWVRCGWDEAASVGLLPQCLLGQVEAFG